MATKKKTTAKKKPSSTGTAKTKAATMGKKTSAARKTPVKKAVKKAAPAPKHAKKAAKKAAPAKKAPTKKAPAKKPASKAAAKTVAAKKTPAKKPAAKPASAGKAAPASGKTAPEAKASAPDLKRATRAATPLTDKARALLASRAEREKNATPILFSMEDAAAAIAAKKAEAEERKESRRTAPAPAKGPRKSISELARPVAKQVHGAASLADILGFDPAAKKKETELQDSAVPAKWKRYYRLLIELRQHVKDELAIHTADTLKHSSREDSGDLSGYGLHQADAGTDSFDRDFALSLVSSEQDALYEIEQAIQRIRDGSYGACEVTGRKIDTKRLAAVPFTRFSVEGQAEYEKNKRRKNDRGATTAFAESSDMPAMASDDGDE